MSSDTVEAAPEGAGARRTGLNPRTIIFGIVVLVVGAILVVSTIARGDVGVLKVDDSGVSKVLTAADVDGSVTMPLILQEGGDLVHESDHIFQALQGYSGIGKVLLAPDGSTISVEYESAIVGEEQIRTALVQSGYTPAEAPAPAP